MTIEELREHCEKQVGMCEMWARNKGEEPRGNIYEEHKLILELLDQDKPHIKGDYYDGFRNGLRTANWRYNKIKEEIIDTGAYEQEVNGETEFLKGINYCLDIINKYK